MLVSEMDAILDPHYYIIVQGSVAWGCGHQDAAHGSGHGHCCTAICLQSRGLLELLLQCCALVAQLQS